MAATGAGLVLLTLPVVGVQAWFDWLHVGSMAADTYATDRNWIFLSRDLFGIPRRMLLDFPDGQTAIDRPIAGDRRLGACGRRGRGDAARRFGRGAGGAGGRAR